jgi:hypothetical protein
MAKKKKKWTAAARKAFADKMKRARAKTGGTKTKRRKKTVKKATVRKTVSKVKRSKRKGVPAMAKRKHHRRSSASGSKKSYRRSRKAGGGMGKAGVINMVKNAAVAIGGGLVAGALANKLPIQQPLIKALSPALAGILLALTIGKNNPILQQLATGMIVMGGVAGVRAQFPNVPLLAGEESVMISPDLLGQDEYDQLPDYSGMGVENIGMDDIADEEFVTSANI